MPLPTPVGRQFNLVINLNTARVLPLLARADEVIE
jgi:hypothetical protein